MMLRKIADFLGNAGLGAVLGVSASMLFVIGRPHFIVLYGAAQVDFKIRLILVVAATIIAITVAKIFASTARTLTRIDKSIGALGYLVAVLPALVLGYYYAHTLPEPVPLVRDVLQVANITYEDGQHRFIEGSDAQRDVGGFESGQSSRLPQIE
ncbi:MAG: hypothetical protein AAGA63_06315 [Pseudomonadota bacterium]